jgi:hypothetical protein
MNRIFALAAVSLAAALTGPSLAEEKPPWELLDLSTVEFGQANLHYEKSLESQLDLFRESYAELLVMESKRSVEIETLSEKWPQIIADLNGIVGGDVDDARKKMQSTLLKTLLRPKFRLRDVRHLYFVTKGVVKNYLRNGGSLPDFMYDKVSDTAVYRFETVLGRREGDSDASDVFFLVEGPESAAKDLESQMKTMANLPHVMPDLVIHELAETTMLLRARFYDPYFRWFSDGFANAITRRLLAKHISSDDAKEFAKAYDPTEYSPIEKEVNLLYWMGNDFSIATPLQSEDRLGSARYAFATLEAERLIEAHGIECVKQILDNACKEPANNSRNLLPAVKEVTGEDIEKRFRRYQTFDTQEAGVKKYASQFNTAMGDKNYSEALVNLLRVQEVRGPMTRDYANAAFLLFRMGQEQAGDMAFLAHLAFLKRRELDEPYLHAQELFVEYALKCRNLKKAIKIAEEILKQEPDFVLALTVRMAGLMMSGKLSEAKDTARRILELEKNPDSVSAKLANSVLSSESKE